MTSNIVPIVVANNKLIITSTTIQNKLSPNLRLIQNSGNLQDSNSPKNNLLFSSVKEDEFSKKYAKEIFIKFRGSSCEKRIDILQFNVDHTLEQSFSGKEMFIQRDQSQKMMSNDIAHFGAGTEYNKDSKKILAFKKKNEAKDHINLCVGRGKTMRKYKAIKESMFEKSQYCVFIRSSSDCFEAIPVREWYKMQPEVHSRICKPEDAIEEWNKIDQKYEAMSSFYKKKYGIEAEESSNTLKRKLEFDEDEDKNKASRLLVDSHDRDHCSYSSDDEDRQLSRKKKNEGIVKRLRYGRERDMEESDLDDHQGEEVDYMSGSSSASGNLSESDKAKIYEEEDIKSDLEEDLIEVDNVHNQEEFVNKPVLKENEAESVGDSDSSNDSSMMSSFDEIEERDSALIIKQKLSSTINKNVSSLMQVKSLNTTDDLLRKQHKLDNSQHNRIIQEMYKYLNRKPISKVNLLKKLISKKMMVINDQKYFESLLEQINAITHIVNGEKLYSIIN